MIWMGISPLLGLPRYRHSRKFTVTGVTNCEFPMGVSIESQIHLQGHWTGVFTQFCGLCYSIPFLDVKIAFWFCLQLIFLNYQKYISWKHLHQWICQALNVIHILFVTTVPKEWFQMTHCLVWSGVSLHLKKIAELSQYISNYSTNSGSTVKLPVLNSGLLGRNLFSLLTR